MTNYFIALAVMFGVANASELDLSKSQLLIEPSSTKTPMARADLIVGPLESREKAVSGTYTIKVIPFAFKNDFGKLSLSISDEDAQKMIQGQPVEFTGMATSAKDGKTKAIKGKTTPEDKEHGAVSFVVTTQDGDLLFNSSYKIVAK